MPPEPDDLQAAFLQLSLSRQREVHAALCLLAVREWEKFARENEPLGYEDGIIGMYYEVDVELPHEAYLAAFKLFSVEISAAIAHRYLEPITAMQDDDVEFPGPVEFAYYAVYNAFLTYGRNQEMDSWLIVNQALSCLPAEEQRRTLWEAIVRSGSGE